MTAKLKELNLFLLKGWRNSQVYLSVPIFLFDKEEQNKNLFTIFNSSKQGTITPIQCTVIGIIWLYCSMVHCSKSKTMLGFCFHFSFHTFYYLLDHSWLSKKLGLVADKLSMHNSFYSNRWIPLYAIWIKSYTCHSWKDLILAILLLGSIYASYLVC